MKTLLILQIALHLVGFQVNSCGKRNDNGMIDLKGSGDRNDLVFFYKTDSTYDEKELFEHTILHTRHPSGRGYDLPEGVIDLLSVRRSVYDGFAINFSKRATVDQRERLKTAIKESSLVYKVYTNVVPDQINDLDEKKD